MISQWASDPEHQFMHIDRSQVPNVDLPPHIYESMVRSVDIVKHKYTSYFVQAFRASKVLILPSEATSHPPEHVLDLAICLFRSPPKRSVKEALSLLYDHYCGIPFHETFRASKAMTEFMMNRPMKRAWVFDRDSSVIIGEIVRGCGLDPITCTHDQLDQLDPFVICGVCVNSRAEVDADSLPVMNWVAVVSIHSVNLPASRPEAITTINSYAENLAAYTLAAVACPQTCCCFQPVVNFELRTSIWVTG